MTHLFPAGITPAILQDDDEALRPAIRQFLVAETSNIPPDRRARSWSGFDAAFSRRLAAAGFLGLTIPRQYGGQERGTFARYIVTEELLNFGAPVGAHWIADRQSGPLILKYGTEMQKQFYLPPICRGESFFCIGMSEPNSGSDLASVRTKAVRDGRGWVLNGQKIWTTHGHSCHFMIALVRTSGQSEDRQQGLSQMILDLRLPGITRRPIIDLTGDAHFSEVFFNDVRLSGDSLLGSEGRGWDQVTAELAFERSGCERFYSCMVLVDEWLHWIRHAPERRVSSERLAGLIVSRLAPIRALSISITSRIDAAESPAVEAALVKDLGTTLEQEIPALIADDIYSDPTRTPPLGLLLTLEYSTLAAASYSLRGGTREILRGMIARGLGLR
jgi:alkylation response protein AidB-like acyl-CoA dehydrogenase